MESINLTIRMDKELKKQAEDLFDDLGMNMTTAMNVFLRQAVREQRIPFSVSRDVPNAETLQAIAEAERIGRDVNVTSYTDVNAAFMELLK